MFLLFRPFAPLLAFSAVAACDSPDPDLAAVGDVALEAEIWEGGTIILWFWPTGADDLDRGKCERLDVVTGFDDTVMGEGGVWGEGEWSLGLDSNGIPYSDSAESGCELPWFPVYLDDVGGAEHTVWLESKGVRYEYTATYPESSDIDWLGPAGFFDGEPATVALRGAELLAVGDAQLELVNQTPPLGYSYCDVDAEIDGDRVTLEIDQPCADAQCASSCDGDLMMSLTYQLGDEACSGFAACDSRTTLRVDEEATWEP